MTINKPIVAIAGICFVGIMGFGIWHQKAGGWRSRDLYEWEITPAAGQPTNLTEVQQFNATCTKLTVEYKGDVPEWIFDRPSAMAPEEMAAYMQKMQQIDQMDLQRRMRQVSKAPVDPSYCSSLPNWSNKITVVQP